MGANTPDTLSFGRLTAGAVLLTLGLLAAAGGLAVADPVPAAPAPAVTADSDRSADTITAVDPDTPTPPTYELEFDAVETDGEDTAYAFGIPGPTDQSLPELFGDDSTTVQPGAEPDGVMYTLVDGEWKQVHGDVSLEGLRAYVLINEDPATATVRFDRETALFQPTERTLDAGVSGVTPTTQGPVSDPLTFQLTDGDATRVSNPFQAPDSPGFESEFTQTRLDAKTTFVNPFAGYFLHSDGGTYVSLTNSGMNQTDTDDTLEVPVTTVLTASDQAAAAPTTAGAPDPAIVADSVAADVDATLVVTEADTDTVVGIVQKDAAELTGDSVAIPIDTTGQPGPHTIHLIPQAELDEQPRVGDPLSDAAVASALRAPTITVFEATIEMGDQTVETPVADDDITVQAAGLFDGVDDSTPYQVTLYGTDADGTLDSNAPLGTSTVRTGASENVPITLQNADGETVSIDSSDDVVARLHLANNTAESDLSAPPETFDPLPLANSTGFVSAGVSDRGRLDVVTVAGTTLNFTDQALGTDSDGNAVVYVDELAGGLNPQVSDPAADFVVLFEGAELTPDGVVDLARLSDAKDRKLLLSGTNVTPGSHTVAVVSDARSEDSFDPNTIGSDTPAPSSPTTEETYLLLLEDDLGHGTDTAIDTQAELQQQAANSQAPVVETVEAIGGEVTGQYWITNMIAVTVDPAAVSKADLAAIPGVDRVEASVEHTHPDPQPDAEDPPITVESTDNLTVGLEQIGIEQFESDFATRGAGTRIAILDNGLDPDHPDIDVTNGVTVADGTVNPDGELTAGDHGLHVAGTATGATDPAGDVPRYGVAPEAELLTADVFEGGASTEDLVAAIEWAVENDADVASISLGTSPNTDSDIQPSIENAAQNAITAGTIVVGSSGNEGPQRDELGGPVSSPGAEFSTLSVGAIDSAGAVADFSSGAVITPDSVTVRDGDYPETYPQSYVQPTVTAPGVAVVSAGPLGAEVGSDPDYSRASGTSMAAPHVAGAVALIQSATDTHHSATAIETALAETATPPSNAGPNPAPRESPFGAGTINVAAATHALAETTTIDGTVTAPDGSGVAGASVTTTSGAVAATQKNGDYTIISTVDTGTIDVTVEAPGFRTVRKSVATDGGETALDVDLEPADKPAFKLTNFDPPAGQAVDSTKPYTATVTVTNVGAESGRVTLVPFLGLDLIDADHGPIELEPGDSETVTIESDPIAVGAEFDQEPVQLLQGVEAVPETPGVQRDFVVAPFAVGDGTIPVLDPLGTDRGVESTSTIYTATLEIADQSVSEGATELTVSTAAVKPSTIEYEVVVAADTPDQPVLGTSDPRSGAVSDVSITLDAPLTEETDVVVTLRPVDADSHPIRVYDPFAADLVQLTDRAHISVANAETAAVMTPPSLALAD